MPKKPNTPNSRLRWGTLSLTVLSAGLFYLSSKPPKTPTSLLGLETSVARTQTSKSDDDSTSLEAPLPPPLLAPIPEADQAQRSESEFETHETPRPSPTISQTENKTVPLSKTPDTIPKPPTDVSMRDTTPEILDSRSPGSAPTLGDLLSRGRQPSPEHTASTNQMDSIRFKPGEAFNPVSVEKSQAIDPVYFDKTQRSSQNPSTFSKTKTSEPSSQSAQSRLLSSSPPSSASSSSSFSNSSSKKPSAATQQSNDNSDAEDPPMPFSGQQGESGGGTQLSLAKPYCFLLPKSSPALQCAMESVKLIVDEYAKADVHVVPLFRWWGDDYSDDPNALEQQAQQACNLQKAFPWMKGGNQTGSIQVFTRDPIPSIQCGKDPVKDPVSGCSNLCPSGSPSFSTVSEAQCSASTALHESGHSNCCAAQCKNQGDCKPPPGVDAGCGLCLESGGQSAFSIYLKRMYASKAPQQCNLTAAALESIRAGASPNPGYLYNANTNYKPRGKKLDSIFGKKGVKKLYRGLGDQAEGDGDGEGSPMASDDGAAISRRTTSGAKSSTQNKGDDPVDPLPNPQGYTKEQIERMTQPAD